MNGPRPAGYCQTILGLAAGSIREAMAKPAGKLRRHVKRTAAWVVAQEALRTPKIDCAEAKRLAAKFTTIPDRDEVQRMAAKFCGGPR